MLPRDVERDRAIEICSPFRDIAHVSTEEVPTRRCPIMSGTVAICFFAIARNSAASSRKASPLKATRFASQNP